MVKDKKKSQDDVRGTHSVWLYHKINSRILRRKLYCTIGDRIMKYAIVVEKGETSYGAYVPDLPGCVAAAATKDEVMKLIKEAIEIHIEDMKNNGEDIPQPNSETAYIEV